MKRLWKKCLAGILVVTSVAALGACSTGDGSSTGGTSGQELNYPEKNVGVVVQFSAGGPTDMSVRGVLDATEGVTFAVENVTGGSGLIGLTKVVSADTDGYTLGCINVDLAINYVLGRTDISPEDFIPLACSICDYYTLVVNADAPYSTMEEFVEYVREHPGEVVVGDTGVGAAPNLAAMAIADYFDLDYTLVSYEGSSDCVTAVVGDHIDATFTQLSPAKGQIEAGALKPIACVADERMAAWPDIPTVKETYPDIDFELASWVFISAYKGTDEAICEYLEDALGKASASDTFANTLESLSMQNVVMNTEEAQQFIADQLELYEGLCAELDIQ